MDFNDYFKKGIACFENYEYGLALENLRAAQKLNDTPQLQNVIDLVEKAANANARKKYSEEKLSQINAIQSERNFPDW